MSDKIIEFAGWMDEFSEETNKRNINLTTMNFTKPFGYDQIRFCLIDPKDECYGMMRDTKEAKMMAKEKLIDECYFDQDCPENNIKKKDYFDWKSEYMWCEVLTGEDAGCEETENGNVYWQELYDIG